MSENDMLIKWPIKKPQAFPFCKLGKSATVLFLLIRAENFNLFFRLLYNVDSKLDQFHLIKKIP